MNGRPGPPAILSTYRLQLHAGFPLARARALVPYLQQLGITHIHASPILRARRGSQHGYDVVDPGILNPELGDEEALETLVGELRAHDMGIVLDIVPNHMAASAENWRWEDVLAYGPSSPYARWFDIEWRAAERDLHSRVLLPVLGDLRARVIASGELRVALTDGALRLHYFEHSFPLDPSTYPLVLEEAAADCERELGAEHPGTVELRALLQLLGRLPRRTAKRPKTRARRRRLAGEACRRLRKLCALVPEVRRRVERAAARFHLGPAGIANMNRLLELQAYRLVYWRRAAREINYRRFFDVNDLVALHMEDPEVFAQTHALVLDWVRIGYIDGFRIDHPDGLLDPLGYFERLAVAAFPNRGNAPPPIFIEKILAPGERLPNEWPVAGTTGYDFLNQVETLFLDPAGAEQVVRDYRRIVRRPETFATVAEQGKRDVLRAELSAGVRGLARRLQRLAGPGGGRPLIPVHELTMAIVDTIASLPVYRTYVDDRHPAPGGEDRALLEQALAGAQARGRASSVALELLRGALLATNPAMRTPEYEGLRRRFVQRFQQVSGPAAAKGIEDTALYEYVPLLSRNEVGGDPDTPLTAADCAVHAGSRQRAERWPGSMLVVTTHDTKRSADVRSRLDILSEVADEWEESVYRWRRWNRSHRAMGSGRRLPDANTEWLVYQTLVGAWPLELLPEHGARALDPGALAEWRERVTAYMRKAAREAKAYTSWVAPDAEFEAALDGFVAAVLTPEMSRQFLDDVIRFVRWIARPGLWNALSRTVIQLSAPGLPDVYQGDELWSFSLVDPDNRRPVDFDRRAAALAETAARFDDPAQRSALLAELVARPEDGRIKLHVTRQILADRRAAPALYAGGKYQPLAAEGPLANSAFAFARCVSEQAAVAVVPRRLGRRLAPPDYAPLAAEAWRGTRLRLPPGLGHGPWRDVVSGRCVEPSEGDVLDLSDVFSSVPVALLRNE
jgi:(1->4)-alpha-D-glucan 1-alpha-D-glucosylmutase